MSDNLTNFEIESKLSLVVRKPQEGKTTICITSIVNDKSKNIHIVLTMNTLASGMQFFGRMQKDVGAKKIIVFNSKKQTAGDCHHAKNVDDVFDILDNNSIKVVVCCAHEKRIRESIPRLFKRASDSMKFSQTNIKFTVHVDEAHRYIPENIPYIRDFNQMTIVTDIIGYTATPDGIWKVSTDDPLFHKILIRDVEQELAIIRSPNYFGVSRCEFNIYEDMLWDELIENASIQPVIPELVFIRSGMTAKNHRNWYDNRWHFDLGNEMLYLSFIDYILPTLSIASNAFSYHFVPAYIRKATHYQSMELILKHYPTANIIVMNSNGYELFRWRPATNKSRLVGDADMIWERARSISNHSQKKKELDMLLEPSYMIQQLIKDYKDYPTFVTGFNCVGMSVTLINPELGNFDNVVMAHQHFSRDKLYQLCRFLFKYDSWSPESREKIKKTQFHSLTKTVVDTCLEYEAHIERMCTEFAGKTCTIAEIRGEEPEEPSERQLKHIAIDAVKLSNPGKKLWKKFKVYDEEGCTEQDVLPKVQAFYKSITGKELNGISMPKKNEDGFYQSSDSLGLGVKTTTVFAGFENEKWTNRFLLRKDSLNYARVFVGYDNLDNNTEFTFFVKYAVLEDIPENRHFLNKYASNATTEDA
jgi:hypothetical protein